MSNNKGNLVDLRIILRNREIVVLRGVKITVFDALRKMPQGQFDKNFIWGDDPDRWPVGCAVSEIAAWEVLDQYDS